MREQGVANASVSSAYWEEVGSKNNWQGSVPLFSNRERKRDEWRQLQDQWAQETSGFSSQSKRSDVDADFADAVRTFLHGSDGAAVSTGGAAHNLFGDRTGCKALADENYPWFVQFFQDKVRFVWLIDS
eukprot:SAG31_NODE_28417_length_410_cov_1.318328_1_plen_128_part_01